MSSLSSNGRRTIIATDSSTGDKKRVLSLASSSRSTTRWHISLVRDKRKVGIREGFRNSSGIGNSKKSGSVVMLLVDADSSGKKRQRDNNKLSPKHLKLPGKVMQSKNSDNSYTTPIIFQTPTHTGQSNLNV